MYGFGYGLTIRNRRIGPAFIGPLDAFEGQLFSVFGPHRALSSYTGPCWRVRRSIDSGEEDIGFDSSGWVDKDWLTSVAAGGALYVVRDYDKTGQGRDGLQTSTAAQPRCAQSGVVDVGPNGHPCAIYDGINDRMEVQNSLGFLRNASTCILAAILQTNANNINVTTQVQLPTSPYSVQLSNFYSNGTTVAGQARSGANQSANSTATNSITANSWIRNIARARYSGGFVDLMTNGVLATTAMSPAQNTPDIDATSPVSIGSNAIASSFFSGRIGQHVGAREDISLASLEAAFVQMMP